MSALRVGSRMRIRGPLIAYLASRPAPALLLALLLSGAVGAVAAVPVALGALGDAELRAELEATSPLRSDVSASTRFGPLVPAPGADPEQLLVDLDAAIDAVPATVEAPLGEAMTDPDWIIRLPEIEVTPRGDADADADAAAANAEAPVPGRTSLALVIDTDSADHLEIVAGEAPAAWQGDERDGAAPDERDPIEIAVAAPVADELGLAVGDLLDADTAPLRVAGLFAPVDATAVHWTRFPDLLAVASPVLGGTRSLPAAAAVIDPATVVGLRDQIQNAELRVWFRTDPVRVHYADAAALSDDLDRLQATGRALPDGRFLDFQSGLGTLVDRVVERVGVTTAAVALIASAPVGAAIAVLALASRIVLAGRRPALTLMRARGASSMQVRMLAALEGLVVAVPAALIGLGAVWAASGAPLSSASVVPAVALAALVPLMFAALADSGRAGRGDASLLDRGRVRLGIEVAVVGLAGVALATALARGYVTASREVGLDPLLAAIPLLIAVAVCLVVLRLTPLPLLGLQRAARSRRSAVALVGATRAVREPGVGAVAVLPLVIGVASAVLALGMSATLTTGLVGAVREEVGADLQVSGTDLGAGLGDEVAAIDGVAAVAELDVVAPIEVSFAGGGTVRVQMLAADLDAIAAVRPDFVTPAPGGASAANADGADDGIPIYASADLGARLEGAEGALEVGGVPARLLGSVDTTLPGAPRSWVLVDAADLEVLGASSEAPDRILIALADTADAPRVTAALTDLVGDRGAGSATVTSGPALLQAASDRPTTAALTGILAVAALVSLLLAVIAVALALLAAGRSRAVAAGILRILGAGPREVRSLLVWELAPSGAAGLVAGTATGLGLLAVVVRVLDLRALVGGTTSVDAVVPGASIAIAVGAIAVLVVVAGLAAALVIRRVDPVVPLKIGAS